MVAGKKFSGKTPENFWLCPLTESCRGVVAISPPPRQTTPSPPWEDQGSHPLSTLICTSLPLFLFQHLSCCSFAQPLQPISTQSVSLDSNSLLHCWLFLPLQHVFQIFKPSSQQPKFASAMQHQGPSLGKYSQSVNPKRYIIDQNCHRRGENGKISVGSCRINRLEFGEIERILQSGQN